MGTEEEGEGGIIGSRTVIYTLPYVKQSSWEAAVSTRSSAQCSVVTYKDEMGREKEVQERRDVCIHVADSPAPILWAPDGKIDSLEKTLMLGKIESRRRG